MAEITRVPLQPIRKGSLAKLWLGVLVALLLAGGLAYTQRYKGVEVETLKMGSGPSPTVEDVVLIRYKGMLPNGTVFDEQPQAAFPVKEVVPGFTQALTQMQRGGRYRVEIPSELGYGEKGAGPIPPNTDLTFEIDLLEFKSRAEIEAQQRALQQLQAQQGAGARPPGR